MSHSSCLPRRAMDMSTSTPLARRPIFVYTDLHLGVTAITVPFSAARFPPPPPAPFPDRRVAARRPAKRRHRATAMGENCPADRARPQGRGGSGTADRGVGSLVLTVGLARPGRRLDRGWDEGVTQACSRARPDVPDHAAFLVGGAAGQPAPVLGRWPDHCGGGSAPAQIVVVARVPHAPDRCNPAALAGGRAADLLLGLAAPGGWYCGAGDAPP